MQLQLTGRLGAEPEDRYSTKGTRYLTFPMAVSTGKDSTVWVDVVMFGDKQVENFLDNAPTKGDLVTVYGRLMADRYEKDGQQFPKIKVEAKYVEKIYKSSRGAQANNKGQPTETPPPPEDDGLPF